MLYCYIMKTPKLGQHFLTRPEIARWVADAIPLQKGDTVLEIGPGHGILTRTLLEQGLTVVAVEKDAMLAEELSETFSDEITSGQLTLIREDVRDFTPTHCSALASGYSLVANIPYYITGQLIRTFLTSSPQPRTMALLIQKEVAQRIVASDHKHSILSLSVHAYGTPTLHKTVKAGAFSPPPQVDSAILAIENISRDTFPDTDTEERFFEIVKTAFSQKRKMLKATLKNTVSPDRFTACDVPETARPEDVALEKWLCLAKQTG